MGGTWNIIKQSPRVLLQTALSNSINPNLTFTRAAGPYSYQTAVAASGSTFIVTGSTVDTPRFHWVPALSASALIIEPARTNEQLQSNFVDVAPNNGQPDGWSPNTGSAGVDWTTGLNGPQGGTYFRILPTAILSRGCYYVMALTASTQYAASIWASQSYNGVNNLLLMSDAFADNGPISIGTTPHDWQLKTAVSTSIGVGSVSLMLVGYPPSGTIDLVMPQIEKGSYASTWIPTTTAAQTRPAEKLTIPANLMPLQSGVIEFDWIPGFASTDTLAELQDGVAVIFAWADMIAYTGGGGLFYYATDDKLYFGQRVTNHFSVSDALTFTPWNNVFHIKMGFGSFGTRLTVNGTLYTDANAWGTRTAGSGCLGSEADGGGIASSGYKNLQIFTA